MDKMTKNGLCDSLRDERDEHGGFAACRLVLGHDGMHAGPAPDSEMFQWSDAQAWQHVELKPETLTGWDESMWWLPPLGADVVVILRDGKRVLDAVLRASVLADEGSRIVALLLDFANNRRALVSWDDVTSVSWAIDA